MSCKLLLILGLLCAVDAAPYFVKKEADALTAKLKLVDEADGTEPNVKDKKLGFLTCKDTEGAHTAITKIEDGSLFIKLDPLGRSDTIVFLKPLDYEKISKDPDQQNSKKIQILCVSGNLKATYTSYMVLHDINDNRPVFERLDTSYSVEIDEYIDISNRPSLVYGHKNSTNPIIVTDSDSTDNNRVTAECISLQIYKTVGRQPCTGYFSVVAELRRYGEYGFNIYALRSSYSGQVSFNLEIRAVNIPNDPNDVTLYSITHNVVINIRDIQDLPPRIDTDTLSFKMFEDLMKGERLVGAIAAFDQDVGDPHAIRFELIAPPNSDDLYAFEKDKFRLGDVFLEGRLYKVPLILNNTVDREDIIINTKTLSLGIQAIEYDPLNRPNREKGVAEDTISITLLDINDQTPIFNQLEYSINTTELSNIINPENTRQISNNVDITVTDFDSEIYNSFVVTLDDGANNALFELKKTTGSGVQYFDIYAREKILDYEKFPNTYKLLLTAQDIDKPSLLSRATITVNIIDSNDHSPEFRNASYVFRVKENVQIYTEIGRIEATDQDSGIFGTVVDYEIIDNTGTFAIDEYGVIGLVRELDYETITTYYFSCLAFDGGNRETQVNIIVMIQNVKDNGPVFITTWSASLTENKYVLVPPVTVQASTVDADSSVVQYTILSIEPSSVPQNAFDIGLYSGELTVKQAINYMDTDPAKSGIVSVKIRAEADGLFSETTVVIFIIDVNNFPPEFQGGSGVPSNYSYVATVNELARTGEVVKLLTVIDRDGEDSPNGQVTFQLQGGANDDFVIKENAGAIIVSGNANLDIEERQSSYAIIVVARDDGDPVKSAIATVYVTLQDANNKKPIFTKPLHRFQINSDEPVNATIGPVYATDVDIDSNLEYSIVYNTAVFTKQGTITADINAEDVVKINAVSGLIQLAGVIQRDLYNRFEFIVKVEDINVNRSIQSIQTATASVVVFILGARDPSVLFSSPWTKEDPYIRLSFPESNNKNYEITNLRATDPSVAKDIEDYRKLSDKDDYFDIQGSIVRIKKPIDYETLPGLFVKTISCVVLAVSDDKMKTATATIEVTILDLNDNAPVFQQPAGYTFTVQEGRTSPFEVGRVKATDRDSTSNGQVEYSISPADGDFSIYTERRGLETEAVIILSDGAVLDYENIFSYNLVITAKDNPGGINTVKFATDVEVIIKIEDVNDRRPEFAKAEYEIIIIGSLVIGSEVFSISAVDGDAGRNGQVDYFITNSTLNGISYFGIKTKDQTSDVVGEVDQVGRLYVKSNLERISDRTVFELTVIARDRGVTSTEPGTCTVLITVRSHAQDLKPKWADETDVRVEVEEERAPPIHVTTVLARPSDIKSGIVYSFIGAGDGLRDYASFDIDSYTGKITTKVKLDHESRDAYNLLILATDSQNDTQTNQFLLNVKVIDIDDNTPSFISCPGTVYQLPETASVDEDLHPPVNVYRAQACDLDMPPHNTIKYSWFIDEYCSNDNLNVFNLDAVTGRISTKINLDRETTSEYLLCIEASKLNVENSEKTLEALNATNKLLFVKVTVNDVNDLGPKFTKPFVKIVIMKHPVADISTAIAYDLDLPPNNGIRYSIDNINFVKFGKTQASPTAFTITAGDGTISIGTNDYTDYINGYFDITVKVEDYNEANNVPHDKQVQRVYVTERANRIRVIFDEEADDGVDQKAKKMIKELNDMFEDSGTYYEIETISYHVISSNQDPSFDKTDVCLVVVQDDTVLTSVNAAKRLTDDKLVRNILRKYGAEDPGTCDPAASVYPVGWESYWWVLVAFALFIFICCVILIFMACVLYGEHKQYMDSRQTYLVPAN